MTQRCRFLTYKINIFLDDTLDLIFSVTSEQVKLKITETVTPNCSWLLGRNLLCELVHREPNSWVNNRSAAWYCQNSNFLFSNLVHQIENSK